MKLLTRNKVFICLVSFLTVLLFVYLQNSYRYVIYNMEMQHLFLWDAAWCGDILFTVGGLSRLLNEFIVQFFCLPFVGSAVITLFLVAVAVLLWRICRKVWNVRFLFPLCLAPSAYLLISILCFTYNSQNIVDFLLGIVALWIYSLSCCGRNVLRRGIIGTVIAAVMYFSAGSVALYFTLCALIFDLLSHRDRMWIGIIPVAVVIILGTLSVQETWTDGYKTAFLPVTDYMYKPENPVFSYIGWILTIVCMVCFRIGKSAGKLLCKAGTRYVLGALLCVLTVVLFAYNIKKLSHIRQEQYMTFNYYAEKGQWDRILEDAGRMNLSNFMLMNYVNLALSHTGSLLSHFGDYYQQSPQALCIESDLTQGNLNLLSMIHYQTGNIADAQCMAFQSNQTGMNGFALQMLVRTNIIYGYYKVAEKYISLLDKTLFYKQWAESQRKYLYADRTVNADAEYGMTRKSLPKKDYFVVYKGFFPDLEWILEANPYNKPAAEYATVFVLLAKKVELLRYFVDKYYGSPSLKTLPPEMQNALIMSTNDPDYCIAHGVDAKLIEQYKRQMLMMRYRMR